MVKKVIAIIGNIGAGKTTTAKFISKYYDYKLIGFADIIKKIALLLGFDHSNLYGNSKQKAEIDPFWGVSGREFMQKIGTEVFRDYLPTILPTMEGVWYKAAVRRIDKYTRVVIHDLRFMDEYDTLKDKYGKNLIIIRINNPDAVSDSSHTHKSEWDSSTIPADYTIDNNSSLFELEHKIRCVMDDIDPPVNQLYSLSIQLNVVFTILFMYIMFNEFVKTT